MLGRAGGLGGGGGCRTTQFYGLFNPTVTLDYQPSVPKPHLATKLANFFLHLFIQNIMINKELDSWISEGYHSCGGPTGWPKIVSL